MRYGYATKGKLLLWVFFVVVTGGCARNATTTTEKALTTDPIHRGEFLRDAAIFSKKDSAPGLNVTRYDLKGNFDWSRNRLVAEVTVHFRLDSSKTILVLDSSVAQIHSVKLASGTALPFTITKDLLNIDLSALSAPVRQSEMQVLISYESDADISGNGQDSAITAVPARAGDPVKSRVVYTTSEPLGAQMWMPCHNIPSNRSFFSAEFTMPSGETLISNGDLKVNEVTNDTRRMRYETRYSLPSYLMAFAVGEFTTATAYHNGLPVSMWARKGLNADFQGMLSTIIRTIAHYESLLIPYPFEKYAIVILPEFPSGGVEHASITFQTEIQSTQASLSSDTGLMEHELGHQWFGDFMTLETWDDLWIKEGMATLLAEEASRSIEDENGSGRLFGRNFSVTEGDAIRDTTLAPDDKYTSGPYGRAAWLLTQIRGVVGEAKFWGTLRDVLNAHAFGNISTDQLLQAFEPVLGSDQTKAVHTALSAKALPSLKVAPANGGWVLSLNDGDHSMIAPLEIEWLSVNATRKESLTSGNSLELKPREGELLALDPRDVHALSSFNIDVKQLVPSVLALAVPKNAEQQKVFFSAAPNIQLFALSASDPWELNPQDIPNFLKGFSSEEARYSALQIVCDVAKRKGQTSEAIEWQAPITQALLKPSFLGLPSSGVGKALSVCSEMAEPGLFLTQWRTLAADPTGPEFSEPEQEYLALFDGPTADALSTWSALADGGATVRSRLIGLTALARHLSGKGFQTPTSAELPQWKTFFRHVLQDSDVGELQTVAVKLLNKLQDTDAFPAFTAIAVTTRRPTLQKSIICAAYSMSGPNSAAWEKFVKDFGDPKKLSMSLATFLSHPEPTCAQNK